MKMLIFKQLTKHKHKSLILRTGFTTIFNLLVSYTTKKEHSFLMMNSFFIVKYQLLSCYWFNLFRYTHMLCRGINKDHSPDSASLDVTKSYIGKICF